MSGYKEDGIVTLHCMNTKDYMKVYNENKYWNLDEREVFLSQTRSLWLRKTTVHTGQIFHVQSRASDED